ncbi:MAG: phospho-N-acetylmuramoyl-pentapeptide-transferase [Firmicutes bacterium]|nr:phospho-N-acetylmuramoyl-pentapeptide-transferase [Bacillota bacterium]
MNNPLQIIITIAVAFIISAILGPIVIPVLRRIKAGQSIREDGPQAHLSKAGTPTMGGVMIILSVVITCISVGRGLNGDMAILLLSFILCGGIGFFDDFIKVVKKRNLGLTAKQKLLFQIVIAVIIAFYQSKVSVYGTSIYVPIWKDYLNLGWFYIPFIAFVLVAMVNAVNLTDGLDGLASGCTVIVALFLAIVGGSLGYTSQTIFSAAIAGACLGFLLFNRYPAKVFMGDTGSLALGGALAVAAIMMNIELILPIAGGVFVAECLSVIIQVACFKKTGKRVFRMAPLHHHFELGGWKETKVVLVFWSVTLLLCVLSMFML